MLFRYVIVDNATVDLYIPVTVSFDLSSSKYRDIFVPKVLILYKLQVVRLEIDEYPREVYQPVVC
jgi:hypothetical protein